MATIVELPVENFEGIVDPDWCPGCGDFGVLKSVKMGATKAGVSPKDLVIVSGIGCSSNLPGYVHAYGVHSLHGRAVAVASWSIVLRSLFAHAATRAWDTASGLTTRAPGGPAAVVFFWGSSLPLWALATLTLAAVIVVPVSGIGLVYSIAGAHLVVDRKKQSAVLQQGYLGMGVGTEELVPFWKFDHVAVRETLPDRPDQEEFAQGVHHQPPVHQPTAESSKCDPAIRRGRRPARRVRQAIRCWGPNLGSGARGGR